MPSQSRFQQPTYFLLIGNPGVGKSTILNGFIGEARFRSGLSYGSGMTYKFDKAKVGDHTYMDTPGLSDTKKRKQAAAAITEALKQDGFYKIFFVISLRNGRVLPEDVTTMKLVLDAAPITHYGVIINQIPPTEYRQLLDGSTPSAPNEKLEAVLRGLWGAMDQGKVSPHVHLMRRDDALEGASDVVKDLPGDLQAFIETTPGMEIASPSVSRVKEDEFDGVLAKMEETINSLQESNKSLQEALGASQKEMERLLQLIQQQQAQIERLADSDDDCCVM